MAFLRSIVSTLILSALAYALAVYFVGETEIRATFDGKPVKTQVWVNGQYAGETPYKTYLGPGYFDIGILPPDNGKDATTAEQTLTLLSSGVGTSFTADFRSQK